MKRKIIQSAAFAFLLLFIAFHSNAQTGVANQPAVIEVIQFHSEHRCPTCLKIEKLTRETLAKYFPGIPFKLVNVDDKQNKKMADGFGAFGSQLFLFNPATGIKKELTDFAFLTVHDDAKFEAELKTMIEDFLKN